uniref:Uncharacterized protein n=1 Tax=Chromera velia CCMP2878 TaxID=1169474 RepID=A0A0G4GKB2_9ALVE|eukprot:Cvel_22268.t1-p1 / transcript=Cvel_22268.t1 / gene=Cvel_22268 / organism=Chromera_velia_CCMP2878 / gene_product=hypothetical protein / transcript_product=hypothetical protein / location=Cvel_scaffold2172:3338-8964(+) / protein_length=889 / sequence_SO=supercontig / SO=protein_coding / is_pseudo=false
MSQESEGSAKRRLLTSQTTVTSDTTGSDSKADEKENEGSQQMRDESLTLFLERVVGVTNFQKLSNLARRKSSFGLAWLCSVLSRKLKTSTAGRHAGDPVEPPKGCIDLSETWSLSARHIFLFLNTLSSSVTELKLGYAAVQGSGKKRFVRFLNRLQEARENGTDAPRLTSFTFASDSLRRPADASEIFPLLLPFLETLSLSGNYLKGDGFAFLARSFIQGKASNLRLLDLSWTGLDRPKLGLLCKAFLQLAVKEQRLQVETLNLSNNQHLGDTGVFSLCEVLCQNALPCVREIFLAHCDIGVMGCSYIAQVIGRGSLRLLESLALESNRLCSQCMDALGSVLTVESLPRLRKLNLWDPSVEAGSLFLRALRAPNRPPLQVVHVQLENVGEEDAFVLGKGGIGIQTLAVKTQSHPAAVMFFKGVLESSGGGGQFTGLDFWGELGSSGLRMLAEAMDRKCMDALRWLVVWGEVECQDDADAFFTGLTLTQLPSLAYLRVCGLDLNDEQMVLLGEAVRVGNLPRVVSINFGNENRGIRRVGMEALMGGVMEREEGWPSLNRLDLAVTNAGEGIGSLGTALLSGKLQNLRDINMNDSGLTDESVKAFAAAVKGGALGGVGSLDLRENGGVSDEVWEVFLKAIATCREPLRRMWSLQLPFSCAHAPRGSAVAALGSGNLPYLAQISPVRFYIEDAESLHVLCEAVLKESFPDLHHFDNSFELTVRAERKRGRPPLNLDPLLFAIAATKWGLPVCCSSLDLQGGRMGEEALRVLAFPPELESSSGFGGKLGSLVVLNLSDCEIDDKKMELIGEVLAVNAGQLDSLHLDANRISIEGVKAFLEAQTPDSLDELTTLSLWCQKCHTPEFFDAADEALAVAKEEGKLLGLRSFQTMPE